MKKYKSSVFNILCALAVICIIALSLLFELQPSILKILDCYHSRTENPDSFPQTQSGKAENFPWESDPLFIEKTEKYNVVLMAGYKTVLIDPLPGEEANVSIAARKLAGYVLKSEEIFSLNSSIGPYLESEGYESGPTYFGNLVITTTGGGVCKIASTLYNAAVLCDLPIIERHYHNMPVPYVPYGQDATVLYGVLDFKFQNNTSYPILIWAESIGNNLFIAFYGSELPPRVEWHHQVLQIIKADKDYMHNPDLEFGEERLLLEGMDGAVVKSWVTVYSDKGPVIKEMGYSYYDPLPFLFEKKLY